jgi:hypothetical protein
MGAAVMLDDRVILSALERGARYEADEQDDPFLVGPYRDGVATESMSLPFRTAADVANAVPESDRLDCAGVCRAWGGRRD